MKRLFIYLLSFVFIVFEMNAQTNFSDALLIDSIECPTSVYAIDLDRDGDNDIISTSYWDGKIIWYENLTGDGNFSEGKLITDNVGGPNCVYSCDIDNDSDNDILSANWTDNSISWFENMDGEGTFSLKKIITNIAQGAHTVFSCDIDNDGDLDVLSASHNDNKIAWYENIDGHGNFGDQNIIASNAYQALSVYAIDIDGDGDNDVLSASRANDKISWYENIDGQGSFGSANVISSIANGAFFVDSDDIDGDGFYDVVSASEYDNKLAWYKNLDGLGNFGEEQIISTNAGGPEVVHACDFDKDGDKDIIAACYEGNKVIWFENVNSTGNFGDEQIISESTWGVYSICEKDLDNDGDLDVISASAEGNKIEWFMNNLITSTCELNERKIEIYPNPTNDYVMIAIENVNFHYIELKDLTDRVIFEKFNVQQNLKIDLTNQKSGMYIIIMISDNKKYTFKIAKI